MYEVTIKGFKTKKAAIEFINWYEGSAEQDIDIWMNCRKDEGADFKDQNFLTEKVDEEKLELYIT